MMGWASRRMRKPRKRPSRKRQEAEAKKASERLHDRKRQSTDDAKQRRGWMTAEETEGDCYLRPPKRQTTCPATRPEPEEAHGKPSEQRRTRARRQTRNARSESDS